MSRDGRAPGLFTDSHRSNVHRRRTDAELEDGLEWAIARMRDRDFRHEIRDWLTGAIS